MALDSRQRRAIEQLVAGARQEEAAKVAGVNRETISRWLNHDPEFAAELDALNAAMTEGAMRRMASLIDAAIDQVAALLNDADAAIRMRAVAFVFENGPLKKGGAPAESTRVLTPEELAEADEIAERLRAKKK
jgi:hypothetical protein